MNINLHIDHLIVEAMDFDARGNAQLGRSVKQQLVAQLTERGLLIEVDGLAGQKTVRGGTISVNDSDGPAVAGQKIGKAIYRGIGNGD